MMRLRVGDPRGTGDVEMRPRHPFFIHERLEEGRAAERAGIAAGGILHRGNVALDHVAELVIQRQFPDAFAGGVGGDLDAFAQRGVVAHEARRCCGQAPRHTLP